jgi:hypothetical protein
MDCVNAGEIAAYAHPSSPSRADRVFGSHRDGRGCLHRGRLRLAGTDLHR